MLNRTYKDTCRQCIENGLKSLVGDGQCNPQTCRMVDTAILHSEEQAEAQRQKYYRRLVNNHTKDIPDTLLSEWDDLRLKLNKRAPQTDYTEGKPIG